MATTPPGGPPPGPQGPGEPGEPAGADEGATHAPSDVFTRHDEERDAYHCSYGAPGAALTVWDPDRELIVRLDRNTHAVVGFSIPNFSAWHAKHAEPDGTFEVDLPPTYPVAGEEPPAPS